MNKTYTELQKEEADEYQELFNFFALNHDLSLTTGEMDDIIHAVKEHLKQRQETRQHEPIVIGDSFTTPICSCCNPEYDSGFKCVNCGKYELKFAQRERQ